MLDALKALLPQIEEHASIADANWRAADVRAEEAAEEARALRGKSIAADKLLEIVRDFVSGTLTEVPL